MSDWKMGKVYLVGAGCGDAGLITVKAQKLLQCCEAVVYDSLASEELLQWTGPECEKIYVGKRYGVHAMKQQEINQLLVKKAQEGKLVVRLKGGDPYVFGRGGEEFLALKEAGICCEEVPGISSAFAVPAAAGIPVTHRGLSGSVTVVTGTAAGSDGKPQLMLDFETLAKLPGTLVILMGMHHLEEIARGLMEAGKSPDTACAVVMEGTTRRQRCLRTILKDLAREAIEQGFTSPAVIVIGEVARLELVSDLPLQGITVGATGTPRFVEKLSAALARQGADAWDMGFMEVQPSEESLPDFSGFSWLIFTSPNGVRIFLDKMKQEERDLRSLRGNRIAVIGPGTAQVLAEAGLYADYMPMVYDGIHLGEGLAKKILEEQQKDGGISSDRRISADEGTSLEEDTSPGTGKSALPVMLLRARSGGGALLEVFAREGIPFVECPLYELGVCEEKRSAALKKRPDYVVFGSAMGVRAYFEGLEVRGSEAGGIPRYLCIGEQCSRELEEHTQSSFLVAEEASVEGIVACLCRDVTKGIGSTAERMSR